MTISGASWPNPRLSSFAYVVAGDTRFIQVNDVPLTFTPAGNVAVPAPGGLGLLGLGLLGLGMVARRAGHPGVAAA
ncbi:hypothetical protein [Paracraurococcus ruber]|uniref:PEP-CTERM sorting domain-containing protein n=1 Tax=Paracraurococcus ruber TaxID=77675 RepID=A0ABS1CWM5_9PROT|nr:hypothetical protein [Paracraurococcus ruber]MBK1658743.1 hypothetical protein [Paracraurococcus ruber]TDG29102.1 hypothetical protein E2C05_18885 [Paracraurococcus ruber]